MKVLFCWHGAVDPSYRRLFDEFAGLGAEVRLISPREWSEGGRLQRFSHGGEKYGTLALKTAFTDHVRAFFYPNALKIVNEIRRFDPDIIHIMEEPFSLAAYEMIRLKGIARSKAKTILFSFENIDNRQGFPYSVFQSYCLKKADAIIVVPEESQGIWKKRGFKKTVVKIPLGIDSSLYKRLPKERASEITGIKPDGVFKIGYSGRVVKEKGLQTVLEAQSGLLKKDMPFDFYIAGSGAYKDSIKQKIKELGVGGRVHFLGAVEQSTLPAFYSSIDALVLPSQTTQAWKEQFGRVLAEAMACGTPVIGSSSGEIPNVIDRAGLVFKEGDPDELAACIERLMSDQELRAELVESGLEKASNEYSWNSVAGEYYRLYRRLS